MQGEMQGEPRILVVDDDPVMRELAVARLSAAGYRVETAADGVEGLEHLRAAPFDLVISDLDMPRMDGFDMTRTIRAEAAIADVPIIVVTGAEQAEAVERAFAAGATSFFSKPINWTIYSQAVRFVLKASRDQRDLRQARDSAEAGIRFKDGLLSVMSHELRTPLNAIIGFGQILADQFSRENDHVHEEYAEYIVDGGRRLLGAVSDLLLASDAQSGPIGTTDVECSIAELFELGLSSLQKSIAMAQADVRTADHSGGVEILCDRGLIGRAIAKVVENAIKFSPRGVKIVVGAALTRNGDLAILVKDDGPGVSPERMASIGQPFAQLDMSLRRTKEGLGLGLPLVNAIVAAHDGRLRFDSARGQGMKIAMILPQSRVVTRRPKSADAAA